MATKAEQEAAAAQQRTAKAFAQGAAAAAAGQTVGAAAAGGVAAGGALSAVQIGQAAGAIIGNYIRWLAAFGLLTSQSVRDLLTGRTRDERMIRLAVEEEQARGVEFDRKAAARLQQALPEALSIADPVERERRVEVILDQEHRYAMARLEAANVRVAATLDRIDLKRSSPLGALWLIGEAEQHTAGCLFMHGKFWPWEVLDRVHPPRHYGCTSNLRSLGWGISNGYMQVGDIPDKTTAIRAAAGVVMEAAVADELVEALERETWDEERQLLADLEEEAVGQVSGFISRGLWDPLVHPRGDHGRFRNVFGRQKGVVPVRRPIAPAPQRPRLKQMTGEGVAKSKTKPDARQRAMRERPGGGGSRRAQGMTDKRTIGQVRREVAAAKRAGKLKATPGERGPMAQRLLGRFADTRDKWSVEVDGRRVYDPERQALHDRIVDKFLEGVEPPRDGRPQATFTAGGSGSGKSSLIGAPNVGAVRIDPDLIKEELPEYREMSAAGDGFSAGGSHEESSDLAKAVMAAAIERGLSVEVDGVGDSAAGKFVSKLEAARDAGYEVNVLLADVPQQVAEERVLARAMHTGRYIDPAVVRELHRDVATRFLEYKDLRWLHTRVYSNDVPLGDDPVLIAEGVRGSTLRVVDEERLAVFLGKASAPDA